MSRRIGPHHAHSRVRAFSSGVPAALIPVGASVSHPKERLDGHALTPYPALAG